MTHDERIARMAEAIFKADFPDDQDLWDECEGDMEAVYNRMATAALAAAGIEDMLKDGIRSALKPLELDEDRLTDIARAALEDKS